MPENRIADDMPDTTPLYRLLRRTRHLLRSSWVATGLGLTVGLLLGTLVLVTLLDLAMPLWPALRLLGLVLVVVPAAWAFVVGVVLPLFRRLAPGHVARRIEAHIPGIQNRLVSCIDLTRAKAQRPPSPAFYRRLVREALERIRGFRVRSVIDFLSLRRAGTFAVASVAAFALAWVLFSDRLPTAVARIFSPFEDIPPASGVVYTVSPGDAKLLRGEDVSFAAHVEKGEPDKLSLELVGEGGQKLAYDLQKQEGNTWKFTLGSGNIATGFEHAFRYRVRGGGTWSKQYQITLLERPVLTSLHTVLHYPEYMALPEPRVGPPQTADVTGPEGSTVEVVVQSEGDVAEGEVQWLKPERRQITVKERPERIWFEDKPPAGAAPEGIWQWEQEQHQRPTHTEPAALGTHNHWFQGAAEGFPVQPGEHLFAYVYLVPEQKPEALMLQWHDGTGWEHRAFWGDNKIKLGKANTPSRHAMGPLPPAGQWVRLEVPAESVDLQGKTLRGMGFTLHGGQCFWYRAGTVPPTQREALELAPAKTFPMQRAGENTWSGRFPLTGEGFYRVELRNEVGHTNKTMKEGKYLAIPDNPPQVVLERPGSDLVLSEPGKVPLVIAAYDDFGLADVTLAVRRGDSAETARQPVKVYDKPVRSDTAVATLDLTSLKLKPGDFIRYRASARDRKGQTAQTQEFIVRIAADKSGTDQQLANFEKSQDAFREKLVKLIADQAKVRDAVEKLNAKYAPLSEKIKAAKADARPEPAGAPRDPAKPEKTPELDPETAKQLEALRQELAELAKQEQQNSQLGQQVAGDLKNAAEQAANMPLMPRQVADQMDALQKLFQQSAVQPLKDLATRMEQAQDRQKPAPDLNQMQKISDRLQKELEAIKDRLQALAGAQKEMRQDAKDALDRLQREMLRQDAGLTARDLAALKEFIAALRKELRDLESKQGQLLEANKTIPDLMRTDLQKQQAKLEKQAEKPLTQTKDLQNTEKMKKMRKRAPKLPNAPYAPDTDEEMVPPKEEDTDEADSPKAKGKEGKQTAKKGDKDKDKEEEDPLYMPALGGPRPKLDPRFAGKQRPVDKKAKKNDGGDQPEDREQLGQRQAQKLGELSAAEQSLASDQQTLEGMLEQLRQAANPRNAKGDQQGQPLESGEAQAPQDLAQMLRSQALREALAMAARMRQQAGGKSQGQQQGTPGASQESTGNLQGTPRGGMEAAVELGKLDPATRSVLLKMQPKLREELLQGMREEGPEGYRKFIQDYFRRLSKEKAGK